MSLRESCARYLPLVYRTAPRQQPCPAQRDKIVVVFVLVPCDQSKLGFGLRRRPRSQPCSNTFNKDAGCLLLGGKSVVSDRGKYAKTEAELDVFLKVLFNLSAYFKPTTKDAFHYWISSIGFPALSWRVFGFKQVDKAGCRTVSRHFETLDDSSFGPSTARWCKWSISKIPVEAAACWRSHTGGVMTKASSGSSNGQKIAFSMKFPGLGGMGFRVSWDLPTLLQGNLFRGIIKKYQENSRNTHNVLPIL